MQPFRAVLKEYRQSARLSQSKLGEIAGFDHSYVSRLESGARTPTLEAVGKLADALKLIEGDRRRFYAAAGFVHGSDYVITDPVLAHLNRILNSPHLPAAYRSDLLATLHVIAAAGQGFLTASLAKFPDNVPTVHSGQLRLA